MKLSKSPQLNQRKTRKRKGFSLVEVIIAIGIVALLLTGFLGVFGSAQRSINRSLGVKEANMLKDSLETEMSTLRTGEVDSNGTAYANSFHKAFEMIKESTDASNAILIYQYKANPVDNDEDGILPPFTGDDGIQGKSYLTQVAVRKKGVSDDLMEDELTSKTVVGSVYAVRMTQLLKEPTSGDLELSTNVGQIWHEVNGTNTQALSHTDYNSAVITFQAEFFKVKSNSFGFVNSSNWDFTNMGNPVAVVNMAVRR